MKWPRPFCSTSSIAIDSRCRCMQIAWFWGKKTADEWYPPVLCPREASSLSLSSATLTSRSGGIFVKSETTSKDSNSSQALRVLCLKKSANSQEFLTECNKYPQQQATIFSQENQKCTSRRIKKRDDRSQKNSRFTNFRWATKTWT